MIRLLHVCFLCFSLAYARDANNASDAMDLLQMRPSRSNEARNNARAYHADMHRESLGEGATLTAGVLNEFTANGMEGGMSRGAMARKAVTGTIATRAIEAVAVVVGSATGLPLPLEDIVTAGLEAMYAGADEAMDQVEQDKQGSTRAILRAGVVALGKAAGGAAGTAVGGGAPVLTVAGAMAGGSLAGHSFDKVAWIYDEYQVYRTKKWKKMTPQEIAAYLEDSKKRRENAKKVQYSQAIHKSRLRYEYEGKQLILQTGHDQTMRQYTPDQIEAIAAELAAPTVIAVIEKELVRTKLDKKTGKIWKGGRTRRS